ncbi:unnamed protein product [Tilletia laevis]|uniref:Uncharacterized protein n=2 Tax=Tilletia TaxID=13289 RepID=A0A9N8L8A8_9BASI|nr:hypothetical protein CF335_g9155 [Tilletia laevis]CAD6888253.1 unnamed protein product [Tilletia caries]KAE8181269.1 hypothetical protein CF336_g8984 [Tilletia laevis]CAD6897545.1 unnamed protein product [Tilletia laevis]CAD6899584.1 unnamed protein product [Tilletia caries]
MALVPMPMHVPMHTQGPQVPVRGRQSFGVSGFPLPPEATPIGPRLSTAETPQLGPSGRPNEPTFSLTDNDPILLAARAQLVEAYRFFYREQHPDWDSDRLEKELKATVSTEYLALRRKKIEEAVQAGKVSKTGNGGSNESSHKKKEQLNWSLVRNLTKLNPDN